MESTPVHVRIPDDLLVKIDDKAKAERRTRSNAIIVLIEKALVDDEKNPLDRC